MKKIYYIHDNGGRPFRVNIDKSIVEIYKETMTDDYDCADKSKYESEPILVFKPKKIFIGESPKNKMTEFSGGYGSMFDGNSILLNIDDEEYVFIGERIFKFKPLNEIVKYISPVGNNDVPYVYAIDTEKNYYLLNENVMIKNVPKDQENDPYDYYYGVRLITPDMGIIPPVEPVIKNFQNIKEFNIRKKRYTLKFNVNQKKNHNDGMSVTLSNGEKIELDKEKYVKLMEDFGELVGFYPIEETEQLQERLV